MTPAELLAVLSAFVCGFGVCWLANLSVAQCFGGASVGALCMVGHLWTPQALLFLPFVFWIELCGRLDKR